MTRFVVLLSEQPWFQQVEMYGMVVLLIGVLVLVGFLLWLYKDYKQVDEDQGRLKRLPEEVNYDELYRYDL